ncbi:hypothetical protein BDN71DRAFT_1514396 [Pleurotus eryngii]|uniref:Uncharacterized protein n=1 Tax=Pleurotus eryngii TaxID=5323 RepID=A0A9P6D8U6_PLEER|nr:hypothetical protein BDN71DRAFT_1514396 [Pleurotus eryngii]
MVATDDTHCYCPPILFILESNEQTVEEDNQIYGPFYLVSWDEIANIYTEDAMEYVVALSLKGAKVVSFKRMQEAVRASFAFCRENHPHSTHLESDCRRHLTDVMEDFPILTRPNTPPEWEADDLENPLPTTTSTPMSTDLFALPSSPVGSPGGLNTPKSDTFSEVLSSDTDSNDFDNGVQDTGVLTIDDRLGGHDPQAHHRARRGQYCDW